MCMPMISFSAVNSASHLLEVSKGAPHGHLGGTVNEDIATGHACEPEPARE